MEIPKISYHGGHSGQFCDHAEPNTTLEQVVEAYIAAEFKHFALTEHQPRTNEFLYPEEKEAGHDSLHLITGFARYIKTARELQERFSDVANILVGFETEWCGENAFEMTEWIRKREYPDFLVGSVHHVNGIPIDFDKANYERAIEVCGSKDQLYADYFNAQMQLMREIKPEVIGHFDLIKIFAGEFQPSQEVLDLARRNINWAVKYGAIFEVNSRAFKKGLTEPYPGRVFLQMIKEEGGEVTLGDDSHGPGQVGLFYERSVPIVAEYFDHVIAFERPDYELLKIPIPIK